jgi:hypothetical protein
LQVIPPRVQSMPIEGIARFDEFLDYFTFNRFNGDSLGSIDVRKFGLVNGSWDVHSLRRLTRTLTSARNALLMLEAPQHAALHEMR